MHDPMTVAFDIKSPFKKKSLYFPGGYRETLLTIWHVDPEKDGSDDSCDWFGHKRKLSPAEQAVADSIWDLETILDNRPFFPDHPAHLAFQPVKDAIREIRRVRRWRIHTRWHVWHWRITIPIVIHFKRWAFSRCSRCGGRFTWGYSPISDIWDGPGPSWFRSNELVRHHDCRYPESYGCVSAKPTNEAEGVGG